MSSATSRGYASRSSSAIAPSASLRSTSSTGIRVPRITGLPCITPALISMRSVIATPPSIVSAPIYLCRTSGNAAAQQVERHLRGEGADALAIPEELPLHGGSAGGIGEAYVHGALGHLFGAGFRSCGAGDGERVSGPGTAARAQGHGFGGFLADRSVLFQRLRADAEQLHLHGVVVGNESAEEVRRTPRRAGEALAEHAADGTFGHRDRGIQHVEQLAHHDFERVAVARVDAVAEQQFDGAADFGEERFRFGFGFAARAQMDLDVAGGGQDGGHRVFVFLVGRGDQLIEIALAHAGDAQEQGADRLLGDDAGEAREGVPLEQSGHVSNLLNCGNLAATYQNEAWLWAAS